MLKDVSLIIRDQGDIWICWHFKIFEDNLGLPHHVLSEIVLVTSDVIIYMLKILASPEKNVL